LMDSISSILAAVAYNTTISVRSLIPVLRVVSGSAKSTLTASRVSPRTFFLVFFRRGTFEASSSRYRYFGLLDDKYLMNLRKEESRVLHDCGLHPLSKESHSNQSSIACCSKHFAEKQLGLMPHFSSRYPMYRVSAVS